MLNFFLPFLGKKKSNKNEQMPLKWNFCFDKKKFIIPIFNIVPASAFQTFLFNRANNWNLYNGIRH